MQLVEIGVTFLNLRHRYSIIIEIDGFLGL